MNESVFLSSDSMKDCVRLKQFFFLHVSLGIVKHNRDYYTQFKIFNYHLGMCLKAIHESYITVISLKDNIKQCFLLLLARKNATDFQMCHLVHNRLHSKSARSKTSFLLFYWRYTENLMIKNQFAKHRDSRISSLWTLF